MIIRLIAASVVGFVFLISAPTAASALPTLLDDDLLDLLDADTSEDDGLGLSLLGIVEVEVGADEPEDSADEVAGSTEPEPAPEPELEPELEPSGTPKPSPEPEPSTIPQAPAEPEPSTIPQAPAVPEPSPTPSPTTEPSSGSQPVAMSSPRPQEPGMPPAAGDYGTTSGEAVSTIHDDPSGWEEASYSEQSAGTPADHAEMGRKFPPAAGMAQGRAEGRAQGVDAGDTGAEPDRDRLAGRLAPLPEEEQRAGGLAGIPSASDVPVTAGRDGLGDPYVIFLASLLIATALAAVVAGTVHTARRARAGR